MHPVGKTALAIVAAAALAAPLAQAEWYAFGYFEPDTRYDLEYMFSEPANASETRLYFFALSTTEYSQVNGEGGVNPNVGLLRTQIEPSGIEYHYAHLGVWKDCNGDGYIGNAESAQREYPAALLSTTAVCPLVTGPAGQWTAGAHNYNNWVSEFVPISGDGPEPLNIDRRTYYDEDTRIWGDFHRPDEDPFHRSCTLRPFARGTTEDTGGLLNYIDCRQPILETFNSGMALIGDPLDLRFQDEDNAHSGTLGTFNIGGEESSDHAAIWTVDCSSGTRVGDVTNESDLPPDVKRRVPNIVSNVVVRDPDVRFNDNMQPAVQEGDPGFTVGGQMNVTSEEWLQNCDHSDDFGHDFSGLFETDFNGVNPKNKTEADWNFNFGEALRGGGPWLALGAMGWNGTAGPPADGGFGMGGSRWTSDSTWLSKTGPRTVRPDLDNGGVAIAPAYWLSFYAHLGEATLERGFERPNDEIGTYGSWHCGSNTSGIHHGWNCDADIWYINPDGTFPTATALAQLAKPGWKYHLRDVDCYDGRIGDTGVSVQPAYYGTQPCIPTT